MGQFNRIQELIDSNSEDVAYCNVVTNLQKNKNGVLVTIGVPEPLATQLMQDYGKNTGLYSVGLLIIKISALNE